MKNSIWFISIILLACGSKQQLVKQSSGGQKPVPAWVNSKPMSSSEYIGVGRALKGNGDHTLLAKRAALNDLASEIEVTVSSESVMYTLEHDDRFEESYTEAIFLNTDLDLEGFRAFDSWENEREYWMYYRLDKDLYARQKAKKKREARTAALRSLEAGVKSYSNANPKSVALHSIRVLELLQPYWNEPNPGGQYSDMGLAAIALLSKTRRSIEFKGVPAQLMLSQSDGMTRRLRGEVQLSGRQVNGGQLLLIDGAETGQQLFSSFDYQVKPGIGSDRRLKIVFDPFADLRKEKRPVVFRFLNELLNPIEKEVRVNTSYPAIRIKVDHSGVEDSAQASRRLRSTLSSAFSKAGVPISENAKTPYSLLFSTRSRDGGVSFGQQVVWTEGVFVLENKNIPGVTTEVRLPEVKGIHLNRPAAERKSLDRLSEEIS